MSSARIQGRDLGLSMTKVDQWRGRWTCIGGGSAGLGFVLARHLVRQGANVAIVGRDPIRLKEARENLKSIASAAGTNGKIDAFSIDLSTSQDLSSSEASSYSIQEWTRWREWLSDNRLDLAIAAAGMSDRGYLIQLTTADLQSLWEANVLTAFNFSQLCRESLARGNGSLVHIASLAGIVAAPGMGAYSLAKHALVALSRQLRLELAPDGIRVLLVCPGPIANLEHQGNLEHAGRYDNLVVKRQLPDELKKPAGGKKVRSVDAEWIAEKILRAARDGSKELVVPSKVKLLVALGSLFPSFSDFLLRSKKSS